MRKTIISIFLCIAMCLSFSLVSSAETDNPTFEAGDTVIFGHSEQDNDLSNGKEPIEWIVLAVNTNNALLLSRYALDTLRYHFHKTAYWEYSEIRSWLNDEFYNSAFSKEEQRAILDSCLDNSSVIYGNNYFNGDIIWTTGEEKTYDKIYLLSISEVLQYFENDTSRVCQATPYADSKLRFKYESGNCWWWLRTPIDDKACFVGEEGLNSKKRSYYSEVTWVDDKCAVRPAIWVDLNLLSVGMQEANHDASATKQFITPAIKIFLTA